MNAISHISKHILNLLFPLNCIGCNQKTSLLCDSCLSSIPIHTQHFCPVCKQKNTPFGRVCIECQKEVYFDGILVASSYKHPLLSKIIHGYKYKFIKDLDKSLSQILLKAIWLSDIPIPDIICPVPLHPIRLRWRGFNQSDLLAISIAQKLTPQFDIPIAHNLLRNRFTLPQMSISNAQQRIDNIRDAFSWDSSKNPINLQGKLIWIIDDVTTTSITINECAKILKELGAKEVFGIAIAR